MIFRDAKSCLPAVLVAVILLQPGALHADAIMKPSVQDILNTSSDYLELLREYWPKIRTGDARAIAVSHEALNNCWHFRDEIGQAESVDDLDGLLSGRNPADARFARQVYFRCKSLVHHYAEFPGWQDLRLRAAIAGDNRSKVLVAFDYYRYRSEKPRESFAFSPGGLLVDALRAGEPIAYAVIGALGVDFGLRLDTAQTTSIAWQLVYCKLRGNCDHPSSMMTYCVSMAPECLRSANVFEYLKLQAGSDEAYVIAGQKAQDIYTKVREQRFEELDLDLVW